MHTVTDALATAIQHQQAARFDQAEAIYTDVLAAEPKQPSALYLYGVLAMRRGRLATALPLLEQAVDVRPDHAESRFALANARLRVGDRAGAIAAYRRLLARWPDHPGALVNLVAALREHGDTVGAITLAEASLGSHPDLAELHAALAASRLAAGLHQEAAAAADQALSINPALTEALLVRGTALSAMGRTAEAVAALRAAIANDPTHARAHLNLANALADLDQLDAAETLCRQAITLEPHLVEAHTSLAFILTSLHRLEEAITCCAAAIALAPNYAQAHWNQGIAYLLAGDYEAGWAKYEWRKKHDLYAQFHRLAGPVWDGEPLDGRTLLVHAEQGLGDAIQFCRFTRILKGRGARVVLACDPRLFALFELLPGVDAVCTKDGALPAYDWWVDQLSLPRLLGTRLATIPSVRGYLQADPVIAAAWRDRLPRGRRVGLVWAGNPAHSNDQRRSMPAAHLAPILQGGAAHFISLQLDHAAPAGILDFTDGLTDFRQTAGLIANLDLVISVDTAVAHLAGALGRPTWVMLPFAPDWRWLNDRDDSPWYASMRLFRQPRPGDWDTVVARIASALGSPG